MDEPTDAERVLLGELIKARRIAKYRTKSAAYSAAGINSATWDRLEEGQPTRSDRLIAAVDFFWPNALGDWRVVLQQNDPRQPTILDKWAAEQPASINQRLDALVEEFREFKMSVEERIAALEAWESRAPTPLRPERQVDQQQVDNPDEPLSSAALNGPPSEGRRQRREQDEQGEAPDDEGPEEGA